MIKVPGVDLALRNVLFILNPTYPRFFPPVYCNPDVVAHITVHGCTYLLLFLAHVWSGDFILGTSVSHSGGLAEFRSSDFNAFRFILLRNFIQI